MALSNSDVDLKVTFDYTKSPKEFIFEDVTDYSGNGVSPTVADGIIKVVHRPTNTTVYENTDFNSPDIEPGQATTANLNLKIPTDNNNDPLKGEYEFTYKVRISGGSISVAYEVEEVKTHDLQHSTPKGSVEIQVNCTKPEIKSIDKTNYTVNSVTPNITRQKDNGDDGHILKYPNSVNEANKTTTNDTLTTNTLYTLSDGALEHYSTLTSQLDYDHGDDIHVSDKITANATKEVRCGDICDIYCCLKDQRARLDDKRKNSTEYYTEANKLARMLDYAILIEFAVTCDKGGDIDGWITSIKDLGNCSSGCGCDDGEAQLVQGLGLSNSDVEVQGGQGINVTSSNAGNTTIYTVAMDSALKTKLNNLEIVAMSEGSGISISESTSGNTRTFTISVSIPYSKLKNSISSIIKIATGDPGTTQSPTITKENTRIYGTKFSAGFPAITVENSPYASTNNEFKVAVGSSNGVAFYPSLDVVNIVSTALGPIGGGGVNGIPVTGDYRVQMYKYDKSTGEVYFQILNGGNVMTGQEMNDAFIEIWLSLKADA